MKLIKVTEYGKGHTLFKRPNGVGGFHYYSDSMGVVAECLDTAVCGFEELSAIITNDPWLGRNINNKLLEDLEYLRKENENLLEQNRKLRKKIYENKHNKIDGLESGIDYSKSNGVEVQTW